MTDEHPPDRDDEVRQLRDRIKRLERRVSELEERGDENHSLSGAGGTDHRDAAVLAAVSEMADPPSARETLKLYLHETDISNHDTAKRRAKQLRQTDAFHESVRK